MPEHRNMTKETPGGPSVYVPQHRLDYDFRPLPDIQVTRKDIGLSEVEPEINTSMFVSEDIRKLAEKFSRGIDPAAIVDYIATTPKPSYEGVAAAISSVNREHHFLRHLDASNANDLFNASVWVVAALKAATESVSNLKEKENLEAVIEEITTETSQQMLGNPDPMKVEKASPKLKSTRFGGKRLVASVTTGLLVLSFLVACAGKNVSTASPEGTSTTSSLITPGTTEAPATKIPVNTVEPATATPKPTDTETSTATEDEIANANPFDASTFPDGYRDWTDQQQQTFLNLVRENFIKNEGLQDTVDKMKASKKFSWDFLDLMAMFYAQNNPNQLKDPDLVKGKDVVVSPAEVRDALQQNDINIIKVWTQIVKNGGKSWPVEYGWYGAGWIGPQYQEISIFGVKVKIQYSDEGVSGVFGGISSINNDPNTKVLWVMVKDSSGNLYPVPRLVKLAPDSTISGSEEATCRENTTALDDLPEGVPWGPPLNLHGKAWTSDTLYGILGKPITVISVSDLFNQWSAANGDSDKLQPGTECYVHGVPIMGSINVTDPYFSPPIWDELTQAK